jgi:hypothetical protein
MKVWGMSDVDLARELTDSITFDWASSNGHPGSNATMETAHEPRFQLLRPLTMLDRLK